MHTSAPTNRLYRIARRIAANNAYRWGCPCCTPRGGWANAKGETTRKVRRVTRQRDRLEALAVSGDLD